MKTVRGGEIVTVFVKGMAVEDVVVTVQEEVVLLEVVWGCVRNGMDLRE